VTSVMVLAMMVIPAVMSFFAAMDIEASLKFMIHVSSLMWFIFYLMIAAGVVVSVAALLGGVLWTYHVFLIFTGKTTKEFRRGIPNIDEEPTLCAARGPRLFDPWAMVDPRELMPQPKA